MSQPDIIDLLYHAIRSNNAEEIKTLVSKYNFPPGVINNAITTAKSITGLWPQVISILQQANNIVNDIGKKEGDDDLPDADEKEIDLLSLASSKGDVKTISELINSYKFNPGEIGDAIDDTIIGFNNEEIDESTTKEILEVLSEQINEDVWKYLSRRFNDILPVLLEFQIIPENFDSSKYSNLEELASCFE